MDFSFIKKSWRELTVALIGLAIMFSLVACGGQSNGTPTQGNGWQQTSNSEIQVWTDTQRGVVCYYIERNYGSFSCVKV